MSRVPLLVASLIVLSVLAGCMGGTTDTTSPPPPPPPPARAYGFNVTKVDASVDISEPSILVDPAGNVWIAGPTGFAKTFVEKNPDPATHDSALFTSSDHGATWTNVQQVPKYGRDACPGGGDSDITAAPDGALFLIDLNLENVPIDVSTDAGKTWTFNCSTSVAPGVDRQWVAATQDYVWISVNHLTQGPIVYRSARHLVPAEQVETGGLVFGPPVSVTHGGAIVVDQATGTLYLAGSGAEVEVSTDNGDSFQVVKTGLSDKGVDLSGSFISIALDRAGNVFVAGSGTGGMVVSGSSDHGKTWTHAASFKPYQTAPDEKDACKRGNKTGSHYCDAEYGFAWVAAGGNGTVSFAWYGWPSANETGEYKMEKAGYYVFAGQSLDLLQKGADATAVYSRVSPTPITTHRLCTGLLIADPHSPDHPAFHQCDQIDPTRTRALGDFFETGMDNEVRLVISDIDTGDDAPISNLMYARQTTGTFAVMPGAAPA